jgi:methylmalonyl-CoA mutase N-terminal domain/subunit
MLARGLDIDFFAPKLSFIIGGYLGLFEEVAKIRAVKRIWARLLKERYGAKDAKSMMARIQAFTGGYPLTAQQPMNNIVRVTLEHLACVLGGAQLMGTTSYDEALAIPTEEAVRVAIRTQQIVAEEAGVTETVDPLGGSYYVEYLTHQIEKEVLGYLQKIDDMGGAVKAAEKGFFQQELADAAFHYQRDVETGEQVVVGVNKYQVEEEAYLKIFQVNPEVEKRQMDRLRELKKGRDNRQVEKELAMVKNAAEEGVNMIPSILGAVKAYATLGEISNALRDVFGEYKEETAYI